MLKFTISYKNRRKEKGINFQINMFEQNKKKASKKKQNKINISDISYSFDSNRHYNYEHVLFCSVLWESQEYFCNMR